ncbi:uncharacterized protein LOC141630323 [Silene latifolia]|uniref:uncharacterized protein LOC141630323 n=1 Tax=Silene latifolia TaxID=37657 RepID=UPI003D76C500
MDFRPISCCTTFYKTISKILSNSFQHILPKIIWPEQAAFIKGRDVHENIMMSQTLVKGYGRKYLTPRCLIKIDIWKAFDSLQWGLVKSLYASTKKNDIYFGGVSSAIKAQILHVTRFSEGSFPFSYLGILLDTARIHEDTYGALINKVQSHLRHWSTRFFSYVGKVQLLNSVMFRITNFWCASALLPKNTIKIINKLCNDFFWNIEEGKQKLSFQSWKNICSSWDEGGFDIKEMLSWNKAVLAKKILIHDTKQTGLWFSWNKAYIFPSTTIWEVQGKSHYSEKFRSITSVKEEIICRPVSPYLAISLFHSWIHGDKFCLKKAYAWFKTHQNILPWALALRQPYIVPSHNIITSTKASHHI